MDRTIRVAISLVFFSGWILAGEGDAAARPVEELRKNLRVERVTADTYMVTDIDYFWSNTLVAKMKDGTVVLASSPYEDQGTSVLIDWVRDRLNPKRIVAINTHYHLDGTGGNATYRGEGVEIWASSLTTELQADQAQQLLDETLQYYETESLRQRVLKAKTVRADHLFDLDEGKTFEFGGERVEVFFPGHAHSPDNLVVWLPDRGVLFGGCIIKPKDSLGYLRDANVSNWSAATRKLLEFDAGIVVPGHGKWGGKDLITRTITLAERVLAELDAKSPR